MSILSRARKYLSTAYHANILRIVVARGTSRTSGEPQSVLIASNSPLTVHYYLQQLFSEAPTLVRDRRGLLSGIEAMLTRHRIDLGVLELPQSEKDRKFALAHIHSPICVRQSIDVTGDIQQVKQRFRSRYRTTFNRFSNKNPFDISISQDIQDFDHFFFDMLNPHITRQYGETAKMYTREELLKTFQEGFLMMASKDGKAVAATLCKVSGNALNYLLCGVLNGDEQHIRDGAQTALYVHMMHHARALNLQRLHLGFTKPFFNDGVFKHKRAWGADVSIHEWDTTSLHYLIPSGGRMFVDFLQHNPLIGYHDGKLTGYIADVAATASTPEGDSALRQLMDEFDTDGLDGYVVCRLGADGSLQTSPTRASASVITPAAAPALAGQAHA